MDGKDRVEVDFEKHKVRISFQQILVNTVWIYMFMEKYLKVLFEFVFLFFYKALFGKGNKTLNARNVGSIRSSY